MRLRCAAALVAWTLALAAAASAQTTVTFWHGYNDAETEALETRVIPLFEERHPGVEVEAVRLGYDDLRDRIVTSVVAGAGPDVVRIDLIWSPQFAAAGLLEPLDPLPGFRELRDNVYPGPLSTNVWQGRHYGLPLTTNTQVYVYNRQIFQDAGLGGPPRTIPEFQEIASLLTVVDGSGETVRYGYDMGGPWAWHLLPWIWSQGGSITDQAITTASGHLDGPAPQQALAHIADWTAAGILAPNMLLQDWDGWGSFVNGNSAARHDGPWFGQFLMDFHPTFDAGYATIPAAPGLDSISVVGGENIAIARSTRDLASSWAFLSFMLSHDAQSAMAAVGQIPVIRSAAAIPAFLDSPFYPTYMEQLITAQARTPHPDYHEIERIIQDAFWKAVSGETSPSGALEEATRLVNAILDAGR